MTSAEKQEIRDVIQDCTGTLNVKIDLSIQQQKEFQDAVLQRLDKFNGRVYNLEKITGERSAVIQEFHDFKTEIKNIFSKKNMKMLSYSLMNFLLNQIPLELNLSFGKASVRDI